MANREEDRDSIDHAAVSHRRSRWIAAVLVIAGVALFLAVFFGRRLFFYIPGLWGAHDGP